LELDAFQKLDLAFYLAQVGLWLGFLAWMFVRLERIIAANGTFDLYLNVTMRVLPWQFVLYAAYLAAYYLI
jgi:hypothetical protein